jgi:release factor glutamine methyltransferase
MTLQTALTQAKKLLADAQIPAPSLTAEVLLAHAVQQPKSWLYAHSTDELKELWWIHFGRYLHQRLRGVPTQYITGLQEFYGRDFKVTPAVLIPRPETEHLIEVALQKPAHAILDIGTGSGAIAITLALETRAQVTATDLSADALKIAQINAGKLGATVNLVQCDLATFRHASFDLIVSNPPYIPESASLQREVRDHEPHLALFAGQDGLDVYRRLIPLAQTLLKPNGRLILELGHDSLPQVREMLTTWHQIEITPDLAQIPRVISAS